MAKKILFTGGGSAGHVTVNLALIPKFLDMGWDVQYMGSTYGIEKELVQKLTNVEYISISTGKLRRYIDKENLRDPFRVIKGVFQAYHLIREMKPNVVFSKGGFVSVPVVLGAWMNRVPVIIHESDITPGLANKFSIPFASKICVTFAEAKDHIKNDKALYVGAIIREELLNGSAVQGFTICNFTRNKPVIYEVFIVLDKKLENSDSRMYDIYHLVEHTGYHVGQIVDRTKRLKGKVFDFVSEGINETNLQEKIKDDFERTS